MIDIDDRNIEEIIKVLEDMINERIPTLKNCFQVIGLHHLT